MAAVLFKERDCRTCTANQKIEWGCETDAIAPIMLHGEEHRRCPQRPKLDCPEFLSECFGVYRWFKLGHLPDAGGYNDQAHAVLQIVEIMDAASAYAYDSKEEAEASKQTINRPLKTV